MKRNSKMYKGERTFIPARANYNVHGTKDEIIM